MSGVSSEHIMTLSSPSCKGVLVSRPGLVEGLLSVTAIIIKIVIPALGNMIVHGGIPPPAFSTDLTPHLCISSFCLRVGFSGQLDTIESHLGEGFPNLSVRDYLKQVNRWWKIPVPHPVWAVPVPGSWVLD